MIDPTMTPDKAEYLARCFVNGTRLHGRSNKMEPASGEFSSRFASHPYCREATTEGWGRELRSHLVLTVKRRIMLGTDYRVIENLMPPREWVEVAKSQAAKYQNAAGWQAKNRPNPVGFLGLLANIAKQSDIKFNSETGEIA